MDAADDHHRYLEMEIVLKNVSDAKLICYIIMKGVLSIIQMQCVWIRA